MKASSELILTLTLALSDRTNGFELKVFEHEVDMTRYWILTALLTLLSLLQSNSEKWLV